MRTENDDIKTAVSTRTGAMSGLLRAIDALADENAAARDIPERLLERLAARRNAARAFSG